jgi:hypothetical protein
LIKITFKILCDECATPSASNQDSAVPAASRIVLVRQAWERTVVPTRWQP